MESKKTMSVLLYLLDFALHIQHPFIDLYILGLWNAIISEKTEKKLKLVSNATVIFLMCTNSGQEIKFRYLFEGKSIFFLASNAKLHTKKSIIRTKPASSTNTYKPFKFLHKNHKKTFFKIVECRKDILWIPIYNYSYRKFIYVSI
jgi:hypothetical protein